uniref:Uncharacterized protein n=1 Tax=Myotis myotis TaxID=51298 RepID=A0A7J8AMP4_MYOMY|nr:hypothetical protein mMyoMyo1_007877 [Myotis myotis]
MALRPRLHVVCLVLAVPPGCCHLRSSATWHCSQPSPSATRRLHPRGLLSAEPPHRRRARALRRGPQPHGHARDAAARTPLAPKRVAPAATAPGSAAAGGAQGWAGPGTAPGNSLACWAGLRLPRRSGTWRCPWAGRRGGGECWESLTGAALTQEPVVQGPRQVCVSPFPSWPSRRLSGLEVKHRPKL